MRSCLTDQSELGGERKKHRCRRRRVEWVHGHAVTESPSTEKKFNPPPQANFSNVVEKERYIYITLLWIIKIVIVIV